jgi:hypothetical protein
MGLLGLLKSVKLGQCAPYADLIRGRFHKLDWYEPTRALPRPRFDDQVRERAGDRIDDYAPELSTWPITAENFASDCELRSSAHNASLVARCPCAPFWSPSQRKRLLPIDLKAKALAAYAQETTPATGIVRSSV